MSRKEDDTIEMYGYTVRRGKVPFAELLFTACLRLKAYDGGDKRRLNLRKLGESLGLSAMTLVNNVGSMGYPEIRTLRELEVKAGIPVETSLVVLGVIASREGEPTPTLSPSREAMLNALKGMGEDEVQDLARVLFRLRAARDEDSGSGPAPTQ